MNGPWSVQWRSGGRWTSFEVDPFDDYEAASDVFRNSVTSGWMPVRIVDRNNTRIVEIQPGIRVEAPPPQN